MRNCDGEKVPESDIETILNWGTPTSSCMQVSFCVLTLLSFSLPLAEKTSKQDEEIQFKPARVILQDFTGVPAVVDLGTTPVDALPPLSLSVRTSLIHPYITFFCSLYLYLIQVDHILSIFLFRLLSPSFSHFLSLSGHA